MRTPAERDMAEADRLYRESLRLSRLGRTLLVVAGLALAVIITAVSFRHGPSAPHWEQVTAVFTTIGMFFSGVFGVAITQGGRARREAAQRALNRAVARRHRDRGEGLRRAEIEAYGHVYRIEGGACTCGPVPTWITQMTCLAHSPWEK